MASDHVTASDAAASVRCGTKKFCTKNGNDHQGEDFSKTMWPCEGRRNGTMTNMKKITE